MKSIIVSPTVKNCRYLKLFYNFIRKKKSYNNPRDLILKHKLYFDSSDSFFSKMFTSCNGWNNKRYSYKKYERL